MPRKDSVSFAFVMPALAVYVVMLIIPIVIAFGFSFTNWNGVAVTPPKFIGFDNYSSLVSDVRLQEAIGNTVLITVVVVLSVNFIGLGLALLLNRAGRMITLSRSVFFCAVRVEHGCNLFYLAEYIVLHGRIEQLSCFNRLRTAHERFHRNESVCPQEHMLS